MKPDDPSKQRHWRNFLLDARFQLTFTAYAVGSSLLVALLLGGFLLSSSRTLIQETADAVAARDRAAEQSRELGAATLSNALFEHLNDPGFAAKLKEQSRQIDAQFDAERAAIQAQRATLIRRQSVTWVVLVASLLAFVLVVGLASIVATHRFAGPLFRVRRMIDDVTQGRLVAPSYGLREKDELKDLFTAFSIMIGALRTRERQTLTVLESAVARLPSGEPVRLDLTRLLDQVKERLEPSAPVR